MLTSTQDFGTFIFPSFKKHEFNKPMDCNAVPLNMKNNVAVRGQLSSFTFVKIDAVLCLLIDHQNWQCD